MLGTDFLVRVAGTVFPVIECALASLRDEEPASDTEALYARKLEEITQAGSNLARLLSLKVSSNGTELDSDFEASA